jgi:hypothetical protein
LPLRQRHDYISPPAHFAITPCHLRRFLMPRHCFRFRHFLFMPLLFSMIILR